MKRYLKSEKHQNGYRRYRGQRRRSRRLSAAVTITCNRKSASASATRSLDGRPCGRQRRQRRWQRLSPPLLLPLPLPLSLPPQLAPVPEPPLAAAMANERATAKIVRRRRPEAAAAAAAAVTRSTAPVSSGKPIGYRLSKRVNHVSNPGRSAKALVTSRNLFLYFQ